MDLADKIKGAVPGCVERTRYFTPWTKQNLRQTIGVKTDAEAAPIFCERVLRAYAEGRIGPSDLEWDDGPNPQSMRLIRVLKGR